MANMTMEKPIFGLIAPFPEDPLLPGFGVVSVVVMILPVVTTLSGEWLAT